MVAAESRVAVLAGLDIADSNCGYAERLLRDCLAVVGECDRITSAELVRGLREIPTSPWRSYEGMGITEISLASMLKLFDVEPKTIRVKPKGEPNSTAKGYRSEPLRKAVQENQTEPEDTTRRNPVTPSDESQTKPVAVLRVIPQAASCGGCKDMHRGIAELAKANPGMGDEELAAKSGCDVTTVRQAKARYLDWKKERE